MSSERRVLLIKPLQTGNLFFLTKNLLEVIVGRDFLDKEGHKPRKFGGIFIFFVVFAKVVFFLIPTVGHVTFSFVLFIGLHAFSSLWNQFFGGGEYGAPPESGSDWCYRDGRDALALFLCLPAEELFYPLLWSLFLAFCRKLNKWRSWTELSTA